MKRYLKPTPKYLLQRFVFRFDQKNVKIVKNEKKKRTEMISREGKRQREVKIDRGKDRQR